MNDILIFQQQIKMHSHIIEQLLVKIICLILIFQMRNITHHYLN